MSINVLHDSRDELYRLPGGAVPAGSRVRMRFWAARPFKRVLLRVWTDAEQRIPMRALGVYSGGIMYEAELLLPSKPGLCWYCFLLKDSGRDYWYGNAADHLGGVGEVYDYQPPSYQITVYDPAFMPPKWLRSGAMYQIFPDRFFRTDMGAQGRLPQPAGATRRASTAPGPSELGCASDCAACAQRASGAVAGGVSGAQFPVGSELGATGMAAESGCEAPRRARERRAEPVLAPFERVRPVLHANWYEKPLLDISANGDNSARDFFGGTLRGIAAKLDYLQWLGVTVLYLNPIFLSPSNHRYNCSDYLRIDPRLGDEADLRRLCAEAARRGMRVMLDGVFSHTGDDSVYFNRYGTFANAGACQGPDSPYYGWYTFERFPDKYKCWWGFDTLPEVNEDSRSFRRFICGPEPEEAPMPDGAEQSAAPAGRAERGEPVCPEQNDATPGGAERDNADICRPAPVAEGAEHTAGESDNAQTLRCPEGVARHYLRLGVSGWRLDVADELPMDFLAELRRAVRSERPDAAILGEVWEDASNKEAYGQVRCYFMGDTLDSVMNYPLRDMAIDFILGRISAGDFARRYLALVENYPRPALYALMNLLGSHDRPRIMNLMAGMDPNMPREQQAQASVPAYACGLAARRVTALWRLICALPGMPCVYYGDEAGARGMGDPFNRGTYPWGYEDTRLQEDFRTALEVRRESEALRRGDVHVYALCDDVLAVTRTLPDGCDYAGAPCRAERFMAIINRSLSAVTVCLDARSLQSYAGLRREGDMYAVELPALTTGYFAGD